jgi:alkanesulfonate monooxygenase SsuD/methylene tetrahydromethanopterin reductase-like flavin-dependent oxidoreductase (luciferase family)
MTGLTLIIIFIYSRSEPPEREPSEAREGRERAKRDSSRVSTACCGAALARKTAEAALSRGQEGQREGGEGRESRLTALQQGASAKLRRFRVN